MMTERHNIASSLHHQNLKQTRICRRHQFHRCWKSSPDGSTKYGLPAHVPNRTRCCFLFQQLLPQWLLSSLSTHLLWPGL